MRACRSKPASAGKNRGMPHVFVLRRDDQPMAVALLKLAVNSDMVFIDCNAPQAFGFFPAIRLK